MAGHLLFYSFSRLHASWVGPWARPFWITSQHCAFTRHWVGCLPHARHSVNISSVDPFSLFLSLSHLSGLGNSWTSSSGVFGSSSSADSWSSLPHFLKLLFLNAMGATIHSPNLPIWKLESHLWSPWLRSLHHTPNHHEDLLIWPRKCFFPLSFPFASPLTLCEGSISCGGKSHHIPSELKIFPITSRIAFKLFGITHHQPRIWAPPLCLQSPIVSSALAMPDHAPFQNVPNYVPHSLTRQLFLCYLASLFPTTSLHSNIPPVPWSPAQMPHCDRHFSRFILYNLLTLPLPPSRISPGGFHRT